MLLIALAVGAAAPQSALPRRLPPVEQCTGDRTFTAFRNGLKQVIAKRDRGKLLALLAPDVLVNFGGSTGRKAFEEEWRFEPTEHGNLWDQLGTLLKMGCAKDGGSWIIPSLPMQVDEDSDKEWVVVLPGAMLFKVVGEEVAYSVVMPWTVATVTSRAGDTMIGVKLPDGSDGDISNDLLYEPTGFRMVIEKRRGTWMITAFVAGD